jgi:signal transduction histidine kinase
LTFSHNGNTFTDDDYANNLANSNGLGLKSVANRLKRLDAKIHFESKRKISEITVIVPQNEIITA